MKYQVILPKSVQKELDRLPDDVARRILIRLTAWKTNPRPADVKKLKGRDAWRDSRGRLPGDLRNPRPRFANHCHHRWPPSGNIPLNRKAKQ